MTADIDTSSLDSAEALLSAGEAEAAEAAFRAILARDAGVLGAMTGLGRALLARGKVAAAAQVLETASARAPDAPAPRQLLVTAYRRLLASQPGSVHVAMKLAEAAQVLGHTQTARDAFVMALTIDPRVQRARWRVNRLLPRVYTSSQDIALWRSRFAMGITVLEATVQPRSPDAAARPLAELLDKTNFELPYQAQDDRALQSAWGRLCSRVTAARLPDLAARPAPRPLEGRGDRRLRIGYASSYFRNHTIGLLFHGWLRHADHDRFKVFAYLTGGPRDEGSDVILRQAGEARDLRARPFEEAARAIRADDLDVLVYPDLGMEPRSFLLASLPLAPVQCMSWGHPVTSGLPTMDWFLTSDLMEAPGGEAHYTERVHRLPRLSVAYVPPGVTDAKGRRDLGLPEDAVLYLCCQAQQKYLPMHDQVFPAIAREVPKARFVFIEHRSMVAVNAQFRQRVERVFRAAGLDPARHLIFLPWQPWTDFLCLHRACDVFLDSIGWSGGNTTLEALSRGLPPVTLPTRFMRGRHTYAMLRLMGLTDLIASDVTRYVRIATRLGRDEAWRREIRAEIERRRSVLYNDVDAVRALEAFYESAHAEALATATLDAGVS